MPGLEEPEEEVLSVIGSVDVAAVLVDSGSGLAHSAVLDKRDAAIDIVRGKILYGRQRVSSAGRSRSSADQASDSQWQQVEGTHAERWCADRSDGEERGQRVGEKAEQAIK